jgi:hypothetical protein
VERKSVESIYLLTQENIDRNGINKPKVTAIGQDRCMDKSGNADTYLQKPSALSALSALSDLPETEESVCESCGERLIGDPFLRKLHECEVSLNPQS